MMGSKTPERPPISNDLLSKIPPGQLREMREAFQVLDRDNDGLVNREDIADALNNLGEDSSSLATGAYFPPNGPRSINLPTYLNQIATHLAPLSSSQELLNAFAAFDEDDSGQIDLAELRDALLHTSPEGDERQLTESEINEVIQGFTGRRAFGAKGNKASSLAGSRNRAEVFRYEEFIGNLTGGGGDPNADKSKPKDS
ncbi:calmodulin [Arthroderma uncinatum]|uniref:calmodulin n=1 Tax=Arthroderma uncinatum TaxID=74035 RepID=UPI00144A5717|nr:calmodulin [Arthroderma uncinatum]KAF3484154.1 calmodulin [Arthroderma uncinatum]